MISLIKIKLFGNWKWEIWFKEKLFDDVERFDFKDDAVNTIEKYLV